MAKTFHYQGFQKYPGFEKPNGTFVPNDVFDFIAPYLTEAELRVLLYIIRRTFGFQKESDSISLSQMVDGIRNKDGVVLDQGTGMSRRGVMKGCAGLFAKGLILVEKRKTDLGDSEINIYRLRFREVEGVGNNVPYGREQSIPRVGNEVTPQNKVIQNKDLQYRDISRSITFEKSEETTRPPGESLTPLASLLTGRQTLLDQRKNNRFSKTPPPEIEAAIRDVSAKLSDQEHLRENQSQAANLFRAWGGVNGSSFASYVYEAYAITKQQAQVKKQMPYFFRVLKGLLGLADVEQGSIAPG